MAKTITDYEIISGSMNEVVKYVKTGLNTGWQPYGELKAVYQDDVELIEYVQAMVFYTDEEQLSGV